MPVVTPLPASEHLALPPGIYDAFQVGTLQSRDGDEFNIYAGLDHYMIEQLKERSLDASDTDIQRHTSDRQRFGEGSYEKWYGKKRTPFTLVHARTNALAGLVWFGPKPLGRKSLRYLSDSERADEHAQEDGGWHTIVYRSYAPFRGAGLMTAFTRFAINMYRRAYPGAKLWAGISDENLASRALITKLGFERDAGSSDEAAHWSAYILAS